MSVMEKTLQKMLANRVNDLDQAYDQLRKIHCDVTHVNDESKESKEAMVAFHQATLALWRLKAAIADDR